MAREYAQIKLSIWSDDAFRSLSPLAQHLYMVLLTHGSLNHCGVADWRPRRIAALSAGWSASDVEAAGKELAESHYLVIDEDTEEVLIRSFMRNDGLMRNPKMAVAVSIAYAAVASTYLRQVIVHELIRLRDDNPDWSAWALDRVSNLLLNPSGLVIGSVIASPIPDPIGSGTGSPAPTPAPTPTTSTAEPRKRGTRIDPGYRPTPDLIAWARAEAPGIDIRGVTEQFIDYWTAATGQKATKLDWDATWRTWVRNDKRFNGASRERPAPQHIWEAS